MKQAGRQAGFVRRGFFKTGAGVVLGAATVLGQQQEFRDSHRDSTWSLLGQQQSWDSNSLETATGVSGLTVFLPTRVWIDNGHVLQHHSTSPARIVLPFFFFPFKACQAPSAWAFLLRRQNNFEIPSSPACVYQQGAQLKDGVSRAERLIFLSFARFENGVDHTAITPQTVYFPHSFGWVGCRALLSIVCFLQIRTSRSAFFVCLF